MGTNTSIFSFYKPGDHESGYTSTLNANWDSLDSLINDRARKTATNTFSAVQTFSAATVFSAPPRLDNPLTFGPLDSGNLLTTFTASTVASPFSTQLNIQSNRASPSKMLVRVVPNGAPSPDTAEFTLVGEDAAATAWWADYKVTKDSSTLKRVHFLTDASPGIEPITRYNFQIDGVNQSSLLEEFTVSRDDWADAIENETTVDGVWMFRIIAGTGVTALEQNTIDMADGALILGAQSGSADVVFHSAQIRPWTDNSATLGSSAFRWGEAWFASFIEMVEISTPAAGAANHGRLFLKDNGSGKTQLCVIFNTGAIQIIATQP